MPHMSAVLLTSFQILNFLYHVKSYLKGEIFLLKSKDNKVFIKTVSALAVPIILQEVLNASVNMLDVVMIGSMGIKEVTAIGLSNQIFFLFMVFCSGGIGASSIFTGQFFGKGDIKSIHKVMGICFAFTLVLAALFAAGAFFFPHHLMRIYSNDEIVIALSAEYLKYISISYFFTAITISLNGILRSIGQTKIPMATTMVALFSNLILTYIFIFVLELGVAGTAIATVIARAIEITVQMIIINKLRLPIVTKIQSYFVADKAFIKTFFKTGVPVMANAIIWSIGVSFYQIAYKFAGTDAQGAMQIANTVQNVFIVVGMAIGTSCGIMMANLLGAGNREKAIEYSRKCLISVVAVSSLMGILLALFSPYIINLFDIEDAVKQSAQNLMYIISFGVIIKNYNYTAIVGIIRSGGDTKFCLFLDMGAVWLVGIPMGFLAATVLHLPIHFILLMIYAEEFVKIVLCTIRVLSNKWAKNLVG